jgi:hypothetical protein
VDGELERVDPAELARFLAGPVLPLAHRAQLWERLRTRIPL